MKIRYIILFLIVFIFISCKKDTEEFVRPVKIQEINSVQNDDFNIEFPAEILPTQKALLAFKHGGTIKDIKFKIGDFVKKGQVIAVMDNKDYKVNLDVYSKKYEAAKAVSQNAEMQFERVEKLYKGGAIAKKDYENASMQKKVAISTFKEAYAGLENAKNILNDTKIVAPYDGYIDKKIVEIGTVVSEGAPVISFISDKMTDILVNFSLKDVENIKNYYNMNFKLNSSGKVYPIKIKNIAQNPDSISLTYPITFTFSSLNKDEKFLSGETGIISASIKNIQKNEILLPLDAIFENNGSNVYLFKNGIAVKTAVEIGELRGTDKISIVKGLKTGDKVIVAGVSKLTDGEKVRLLGGNK